jgi:hypothetical protein
MLWSVCKLAYWHARQDNITVFSLMIDIIPEATSTLCLACNVICIEHSVIPRQCFGSGFIDSLSGSSILG